MKIQAVVFDLDGTLYPFARAMPRFLVYALFHMRILYRLQQVRKQLRNGRENGDFYIRQNELMADTLGMEVDDASVLIQKKVYRRLSRVLSGVTPYRGVLETLRYLRIRGLKLAVLSDFPPDEKLSALGLEGFWDYTGSSEESGYLKPNPEPFYHCAEALGVNPERMLYVGNSYTFDILGASRVGMKTAYFHRLVPRKRKADIIFSDYTCFIDTLEEANFL